MLAGEVEQAGDQLGDGVPAVRAGDADQRDAAGLAVGEQVVDDGLADRARLADARLDVHQQAGAGIDFDDGAALFGQRLAKCPGRPGRRRRCRGRRRGRRAAACSAVSGWTSSVQSKAWLALRWISTSRPSAGTLSASRPWRSSSMRAAVSMRMQRQRMQFGGAAARVGVDLAVDQFAAPSICRRR